MDIINIIVLALSSLLLTFVGSVRLFKPIETYAKNSGITLPSDASLLNEMRGVSAVMLSAGIIIALGIFIPSITITSFFVAILVFIGFAIGRIMSISMDGKPSKQITQGLVFELVLGGASVFCLIASIL